MPHFTRCLLLLLFFPFITKAQYTLRLHSTDTNEALLQKEASPEKFTDAPAIYQYLTALVPALQEKGYLSASVDSFTAKDNVYDAWVFLGRQYKWARVSFDSIPPALLTEAAINTQLWEGRPLSVKQVSRITEKLLQYCENNAYPFARVWLDNVVGDKDGGVSATFMLQRDQLRYIDSLSIEGDIKVTKAYLMRYLDIFEGSDYSEKKLRNISPRLRELPFLQEAAPWTVEFKLTDTRLKFYLKEKKANLLNAIIGLLPNSVETGKFLLTADATLALQNILGYGESIGVTYQNLQYKSPRINADAVWPYLLNTPFGVDAHFSLFKKDTTFSRTSFQSGLRYQLNATDHIRLFYQNQSNRLIYIDTNYVRTNHLLPGNADVAANGAGLEWNMSRLDYRLNPRRGWQFRISTNALVRKVRRSDAVTLLNDGTGFDYSTLYDSLEQQKYQYHAEASISYFIPLGKKATLLTAYNGAWVSGRHLFQNELYQIGGFKLLRGFDEQSVYANQYHVLTLELRLLLDKNSYVYLFSDNAYLQIYFSGYGREGLYNGFGVGTALQTKSGVFSISYALGRSDTNPIQFKQSKIHFGYAAYF